MIYYKFLSLDKELEEVDKQLKGWTNFTQKLALMTLKTAIKAEQQLFKQVIFN